MPFNILNGPIIIIYPRLGCVVEYIFSKNNLAKIGISKMMVDLGLKYSEVIDLDKLCDSFYFNFNHKIRLTVFFTDDPCDFLVTIKSLCRLLIYCGDLIEVIMITDISEAWIFPELIKLGCNPDVIFRVSIISPLLSLNHYISYYSEIKTSNTANVNKKNIKLISKGEILTKREYQAVLDMLLGSSARCCALRYNISVKTIYLHRAVGIYKLSLIFPELRIGNKRQSQ